MTIRLLIVSIFLIFPAGAFGENLTVYGSVRVGIRHIDQSGRVLVPSDDENERLPELDVFDDGGEWDLSDELSRLGFRGSEDLGNGLSAIYHYEFGVDSADGPTLGGAEKRLAYAGLKGNWGTVTIGTNWIPYYTAVGEAVDLFWGPFTANGYYEVAGLGNFEGDRSGNLITYQSPDLGDLNLMGSIKTSADGGETGVDEYQLAAVYDNGALFLGAAFRELRKDSTVVGIEKRKAESAGLCDGPAPALICAVKVKNDRQFGGSAGYRFDFGLSVSGSVQKSDNNFQDDWTSYDLYGEYDFGNNVVRAAYFNAENDKGSEQNTDGWIVGFDHAFSERTLFWVEYGDSNTKDRFNQRQDVRSLSIGFKQDF